MAACLAEGGVQPRLRLFRAKCDARFFGKDDRVSNFLSIVENIGVEPMTSSMPWKRSSQLS
jgi:hypothetical protein